MHPPRRLGFLALLSLCLAVTGCSDPANTVPKSSGSSPQPATPPSATPAGRLYTIRPESKVGFVGSKVTGSHNGGFTNVTGSFTVSGGKIVGSPEIVIDMKSTWADNARLSGHLKSPDFFDVEKYPTSTFTATSVDPADPQGKIVGNLTLHGVTKSITFPAAIQVADEAVTVKAQFAINRKDFNISYAGKADDLIRDNVIIKLDVRAMP
jgi:polyisoprenoid-binding protein YceI